MSYAFLSALGEPYVNEQHAMLTSPGGKSRPTFEELLRELRRATRKYHQKPQLSASHRIVSVSISVGTKVRTDVEFFLGPKSTIRHLIACQADLNYQAYMISCVAYVLMMLRFYASISLVL